MFVNFVLAELFLVHVEDAVLDQKLGYWVDLSDLWRGENGRDVVDEVLGLEDFCQEGE